MRSDRLGKISYRLLVRSVTRLDARVEEGWRHESSLARREQNLLSLLSAILVILLCIT